MTFEEDEISCRVLLWLLSILPILYLPIFCYFIIVYHSIVSYSNRHDWIRKKLSDTEPAILLCRHTQAHTRTYTRTHRQTRREHKVCRHTLGQIYCANQLCSGGSIDCPTPNGLD